MSDSKQPLSCRLATISESPHMAALINSAFRSEPTGQTWLFDDRRVDIVSAKDTGEFISGTHTVMLAWSLPNEPLVMACCYLRSPSSPPQEHVTAGSAWLGFLAIEPTYHHRGFGRILLADAEAFAKREWNAKRMEFDVVNSRTQLRAWYKRCGYEDTGVKRSFFYGEKGREILADGLEMIVMGKNLAP